MANPQHLITTIVPVNIAIPNEGLTISRAGQLMAIANKIAAAPVTGTRLELPAWWLPESDRASISPRDDSAAVPVVLLTADEELRRGAAAGADEVTRSLWASEEIKCAAALVRDWCRYDARDLSAAVVKP